VPVRLWLLLDAREADSALAPRTALAATVAVVRWPLSIGSNVCHHFIHNRCARVTCRFARCVSSSLDIIALQEIGDPAVSTSSMPHHTLVFAPGPSNYEAGVGLLISHALTPRCRAYKRSKGGRLASSASYSTSRNAAVYSSSQLTCRLTSTTHRRARPPSKQHTSCTQKCSVKPSTCTKSSCMATSTRRGQCVIACHCDRLRHYQPFCL
jgi:hypothetical protein